MYVSINKKLKYSSAYPSGTICGILTTLLFTDYLKNCIYLKEAPLTKVSFGALYNRYAISDERGITAEDWRVPMYSDWKELILHLDPLATVTETTTALNVTSEIAGGKLKDTDSKYWIDDLGSTNEVNFNLRGGGIRHYSTGSFGDSLATIFDSFVILPSGHDDWRDSVIVWSGDTTIVLNCYCVYPYEIYKKLGKSLRCVRNATEAEQLLNDGASCNVYVGNDGKIYPTVKIGNQVWLAVNSSETKFRNGDDIPEITDGATWASMTSAAMCAYNNDWDNV